MARSMALYSQDASMRSDSLVGGFLVGVWDDGFSKGDSWPESESAVGWGSGKSLALTAVKTRAAGLVVLRAI